MQKNKCTCYGQHNTTKRNPSIFLVSSEVIDDVLWIYCFGNCWIVLDEIEETNASNEGEPHTNNRSETVAYFISSKSLNHEKAYQDCYGYSDNPIYAQRRNLYESLLSNNFAMPYKLKPNIIGDMQQFHDPKFLTYFSVYIILRFHINYSHCLFVNHTSAQDSLHIYVKW